jgi:anti-sigma regulatory factor (Ser/Thr protein kinase)
MARAQQRWELTLDARQSSLGEAADFIEELCGLQDLDDDVAFAVRLATEEACQNVVEHACRFDPDEQFTLQCERAGADLVITVSDRGAPFDPTKAATPKLDVPLAARSNGGLGIHFIRNMMDELHYRRDADGVNHVTMVKRNVFAKEKLSEGSATGGESPQSHT